MKFSYLTLQMLHNKFGKDWLGSSWEDDVNGRCTTDNATLKMTDIVIGHLSDSGELVNLPVRLYRFPGTPYSPFPFLHIVSDLDNIYWDKWKCEVTLPGTWDSNLVKFTVNNNYHETWKTSHHSEMEQNPLITTKKR